VPYDKNIFTPVIRTEIREQAPINNGHYTVYLPSYSDKKIIKLLSCFTKIKWEVFSKHSKETYAVENTLIRPIHNDHFIESMATSEGVLCNAGFQTPAEALFLKKKLMFIPMKGQYEQQCNAVALKMMSVPGIKNIKFKQYKKLKEWVESDARVAIDFPDDTIYIIDEILERHAKSKQEIKLPEVSVSSPSKFRNLLVKKIFYQLGS
jgi:uncharacterized protein (TIGR00661 family)